MQNPVRVVPGSLSGHLIPNPASQSFKKMLVLTGRFQDGLRLFYLEVFLCFYKNIKQMEDAWTFFDHIGCITVNLKSKRMQELKKNLKQVGLQNLKPYLFPRVSNTNLSFTPHQTTLADIFEHGTQTVGPLALDLGKNHLHIISKAYRQGCKNVLVMEDDAHFDNELTLQFLPNIVFWLKRNDWDIFNFGSIEFPVPFRYPVAPGIALGVKPLLAHCYVLSRCGMAKIIQYWKSTQPKLHIDRIFANLYKKYHVAHPPINFQTEKPALFRQAMTLLPPSIEKVVNHGSFQFFCQQYHKKAFKTFVLFIIVVAAIIFKILVKCKTLRV